MTRLTASLVALLAVSACAAPELEPPAPELASGSYPALTPTAAGCHWECPDCAGLVGCRPCQLVCPADLEGCGEGVCGSKATCCNDSCGICAPNGASCSKDRCIGDNYGCESDGDCRMFANTCDGCGCHALGPRQLDPICTGSLAKCSRNPCRGRTAVCDLASGACLLR